MKETRVELAKRKAWLWVALALAAGCADLGDGLGPVGPAQVRVIVLNSVGQAYNVMDLDAEGRPVFSQRVALPANFDGLGFDVRGTVALTTGSELKGSWVFLTDLSTGTTHPLDLPDFDDPAAARYWTPDTAFVAARGAGLIYRLIVSDSAIAPLTDTVAQSPYDVLPSGDRLYVVDGNQDRATFEVLGPSRVVILDIVDGLPVDTVQLTGDAAVAGVVRDSKLFVLESGQFTDPQGKLAIVDLSGPDPTLVDELDLAGFGLSLEAGNDGLLYVSVVPDLAAFDVKVILVVDPATNAFVNGPDAPLPLRRPDGTDASCYAATASADGSVFCIEDRGVERGLLYTYEPDLTGKTQITLDALPTDLVVLDFP